MKRMRVSRKRMRVSRKLILRVSRKSRTSKSILRMSYFQQIIQTIAETMKISIQFSGQKTETRRKRLLMDEWLLLMIKMLLEIAKLFRR